MGWCDKPGWNSRLGVLGSDLGGRGASEKITQHSTQYETSLRRGCVSHLSYFCFHLVFFILSLRGLTEERVKCTRQSRANSVVSLCFSPPLTRGKTALKSLVVPESRNELSAGKELENGTKNVI